jgi:sugar phosphate isomerase/epimerase
MLPIGLNPYGIAYSVGLQGVNTPRANPNPLGLWGYLDLAEAVGATRTIELPTAWLAKLDDAGLERLIERLAGLNATPVLSQGTPVGGVETSLALAAHLGAPVVRTALTPVLCGDRAAPSCGWPEMVAVVRDALRQAGAQAQDAGVFLAIENHQDFTSAELRELCEASGPAVGVCLDTANALAVGEDCVSFARTVAPLVRHVHLKDYRVQWTGEGYRLIRCATGDGAVPFVEVVQALAAHHPTLPAVIEIGALSARHVRLLTADWWTHYPDRPAHELAAGLLAARQGLLDEGAEWRTPWEQNAPGDEIIAYEQEQLRASVANLQRLGLMA